jgi:excisionase family DNA binding protein
MGLQWALNGLWLPWLELALHSTLEQAGSTSQHRQEVPGRRSRDSSAPTAQSPEEAGRRVSHTRRPDCTRLESPVHLDRTALPSGGAPGAARTQQVCRLTYTVAEAAALLDISVWSYYRGLRTGELPGRKVCGQWRVSRSQLHRFLDESLEPAAGVHS